MPSGKTKSVGETVIRRRRQRDSQGKIRGVLKVRFVKLPSGKWKRFARHLWESINGPLPAGHRVYHLDFDNLNDDPDNLAAMTPGQWINYCHEQDPKMSAENRRGEKRLGAMRKFNSTVAAVRRQFEFLPLYWYLVDDAAKQVVNEPYRRRSDLCNVYGIEMTTRGRLLKPTKYRVIRGRDLNEDDQRRHYKKIGNKPGVKSLRGKTE